MTDRMTFGLLLNPYYVFGVPAGEVCSSTNDLAGGLNYSKVHGVNIYL